MAWALRIQRPIAQVFRGLDVRSAAIQMCIGKLVPPYATVQNQTFFCIRGFEMRADNPREQVPTLHKSHYYLL